MDTRQISEEYTQIAKELIDTEAELEYIKNSNVQIIYLASQHKKVGNHKKILGQCEKIAEKYKWGIPCDFTITVFEPNIEGFTDEQVRMLLFHELLHVGIETTADGEESYSIVPHDLEDFKTIIKKYGTDWNRVNNEENR